MFHRELSPKRDGLSKRTNVRKSVVRDRRLAGVVGYAAPLAGNTCVRVSRFIPERRNCLVTRCCGGVGPFGYRRFSAGARFLRSAAKALLGHDVRKLRIIMSF